MTRSRPHVLLLAYEQQMICLGNRFLQPLLWEKGYDCDLVFMPDLDEKTFEGSATQRRLYELVDTDNTMAIGWSVMTHAVPKATVVTEAIRRDFNLPVIWGGSHCEGEPEGSAAIADAACLYDAEDFFPAYLQALQNGNAQDPAVAAEIPNFIGNVDGQLIRGPRVQADRNLSKYPYPSFDTSKQLVIKNGETLPLTLELQNSLYPRYPYLYFTIASRGCPFQCTFCSAASREVVGEARFRRRSPAHVLEELREMKKHQPDTEFVTFGDAIFTLHPVEWIAEFAEGYRKDIDIPFSLWVHPKIAPSDKLELLKEAGLYITNMGVQSLNNFIRKDVFKRKETDEDVRQTFLNLSKLNLSRNFIDFIGDNPVEDDEGKSQGFETLNRILPRGANFWIQIYKLRLLPGTHLVPIMEDEYKDALFELNHDPYPDLSRDTVNNVARTLPYLPKSIAALLLNNRDKKWAKITAHILFTIFIRGQFFVWRKVTPLLQKAYRMLKNRDKLGPLGPGAVGQLRLTFQSMYLSRFYF